MAFIEVATFAQFGSDLELTSAEVVAVMMIVMIIISG